MLTFATLGDALLKMYIREFRERTLTLQKLNAEWGLMQVPSRGLQAAKYVHYCPSGDIRTAKGKVCDLCQVVVPEAVEFLAQVLLPSA